MDSQGDRHSAVAMYQQSAALFREAGDQWGLTHPLCDVAWYTWDTGDLQTAFDVMTEYLATFRRMRAWGSLPMALEYISIMALAMGDFTTAMAAAREKEQIETARGLPAERAYGMHAVARVHLAQGNLSQARLAVQEALAWSQGSANMVFVATAHHLMGEVAFCENKLDEAEAHLAESQRMLETLGSGDQTLLRLFLRFTQGQVAARQGRYAQALELMQDSLQRQLHMWPKAPPRLEALAWVWWKLDEPERAATLLGGASRLRQSMGLPLSLVEAPGYNQTVAGIREQLGEAAFAAAWAVGAGGTREACAALALTPLAGRPLTS